MGPLGYYSPFLIGFVLALATADSFHGQFPTVTGPAWYGLLALHALLSGGLFQFVMFGLQGVYAQVLPVPFGKSIRGGAAVAAGGLSLLSAVSCFALALLLSERVTVGAWISLIVAALSIVVAALVYIWNLPAAIRDFAEEQ